VNAPKRYDVLIVGYGPTGMLAAILLGRAGHRVGVFERHKGLYNLPRVGIVHDDILRIFQEIGIDERIAPSTFFLPLYELANHDRVLLSNRIVPYDTHGWPEFTSIYQPAFEREFDVVAKSLPNVDVRHGCTVVGLDQDADGVEIEIDDEAGGRERVGGRYLIGADGGNSFVRDALGIGYEDLGFDQNWLVVDARAKRPPRPELPLLRQFCEPEQPGMTMQMGPEHRRWSFMIFDGESPAEAVKHDNVWRRLDRPEGGTRDEFELIRTVSYKFQSLLARQWQAGRVFLAGDAAHQMPPFLAQGLCSGLRDAHNLAWKLDLVLKGAAPPALLETYEQERGPNARATIVESARVGENVNERDPARVAARDERLLAMQAAQDLARAEGQKQLIAFRVPGFEQGLLAGAGGGAPMAGAAFPQGRVRCGGREGRFDDVVGRGWLILGRDGDPADALSAEDRAFWTGLGGRFVRIGAAGADEGPPGFVADLEGRYLALMDAHACDVIVKRPDFYVFGGGRSQWDLSPLLADLRERLRPAAAEARVGAARRVGASR
jgi:2-polyprenyl-6-methoxyphenol hydroxylase-like FAD-dependent oxidoreductase